MTMIQQENIDILGTLSSNRLDLDASLSDGAFSETAMAAASTIFRDLGEGQQHCSIRLANPIKELVSSFDESQEAREASVLYASQLQLQQQQRVVIASHDSASPSFFLKQPLGCSSNYATRAAHDNTLVAAAPHIDFAQYFNHQDFSSVAIVNEPLYGDDDFSLTSETNSILTSDGGDSDCEFGMYQGSFSWNSHDE
jgi:hypothetical protein